MTTDSPKKNLPPNRRKLFKTYQASLEVVHNRIPMERVLALTFTFTPHTTDKEACAEFSAINRQFIRLCPRGYVRVLAFTKAGAPHLHVTAIAVEDVRLGFDFENYLNMRTLSALCVSSDN